MKRTFIHLVLAVLCPVAGLAQEAEPGGVYFTLDVLQSFEASTDRDLVTTDREQGLDSLTSLSFGAVTETRTQRLSFDLDTDLRLRDGALTDDDLRGQLSYNRNSADASLDVLFALQRSDIAFLRDTADFIDATGEIVLPDDFGDLTGTGIRQDTFVDATLQWGETAPIGYSLNLGGGIRRYYDADATLADADTARFGAGLRLQFNEVTVGNIDLSYAQTDEIGAAPESSTTLAGALTFVRPRGDLTTRISATQDETNDIFWAATVTRDYALPASRLSGTLGLVEDASGTARLVFRADYSLPRPDSQIDFSAARSLPAGDDRMTSTLSARYTRDITPVSNMQIGFDFGQISDSDGGDRLATASLSASYGIELTETWQANIGARADLRDDDGTRTHSNTVFLTLERPFSWRPVGR